MRTTAATKKYEYDSIEQPEVNDFRQSPSRGYGRRFMTQVKDRNASPLRRSASRSAERDSLDRKYGFKSEYKPNIATAQFSNEARTTKYGDAAKALDERFNRMSVYDRKNNSPLRQRTPSPKQGEDAE